MRYYVNVDNPTQRPLPTLPTFESLRSCTSDNAQNIYDCTEKSSTTSSCTKFDEMGLKCMGVSYKDKCFVKKWLLPKYIKGSGKCVKNAQMEVLDDDRVGFKIFGVVECSEKCDADVSCYAFEIQLGERREAVHNAIVSSDLIHVI